MENHNPHPAFEFPTEQQDAMEAALRSHIDPQPLDRARRAKPIVRMVDDEGRPTIKTEQPLVTPMATADSFSVDLPSRFAYYPFKDLYAKPLRVPHLAKMAKAHETGDLQMQVEAISTVLSTPDNHKNIAFQLTMADYTAVLYWLRMTSFNKQQIRHTSTCTNEQHIADVNANLKPLDSLKIETVVLKSDLKTKYLDFVPDSAEYSIELDGVTIPFGPEALGDTIAFLSHPKWTDEEFQYKSRIAAIIKLEQATNKVWTWDQRIQFVDEYLTTDQAVKALEFADLMDDYGVIETVETFCKGCGSKGVSRLTCDPLTFLQPKF